MAHRLIGVFLALWSVGAGVASANDNPVVVELFTSQGCSSCPPADALLHEYANSNDVIALAFHVDYWDYIGWKDTFASPAYSRRQRAYARAGNRTVVYTPQMIIGGQDSIIGHKPDELASVIATHAGTPGKINLAVDANAGGGVIRIRAERLQSGLGPLVIQLVQYVPDQVVHIRRGENRNRKIRYSHIVDRLQVLRNWQDENDVALNANVTANRPVVVIVQAGSHGPILAATRLH